MCQVHLFSFLRELCKRITIAPLAMRDLVILAQTLEWVRGSIGTQTQSNSYVLNLNTVVPYFTGSLFSRNNAIKLSLLGKFLEG